jgi:hypothetical protein
MNYYNNITLVGYNDKPTTISLTGVPENTPSYEHLILTSNVPELFILKLA